MNCDIGDKVEVSPTYVPSYVATVVGFDVDYYGKPTVTVAADDGTYYDVPTSWLELYVE